MVGRRPLAAAALVSCAAGLLLSGALGGCELLLDTSSLTERSDGGSDATAGADAGDATTDHTVRDASDGGDAMTGNDVGSTDAQPCTGPIFYVSATSGDDANPGCSPGAAKRTISAGIAAAKLYTASPPTVEVCAGTYAAANLQLDFPGSLLGGFDCSTWGAGDGGAPGSVISNASPATQAATLVMFGSAVKLQGFTIQGAPSVTTDGGTSSLTYSALQITGPGSPMISGNVLTGGSGAGGVPASAGVVVDGASPLIASNTIAGGSGVGGSGSAPASVGIFVTSGGAPTVRGNAIDGGSGMGVGVNASGSAGIMAFATAGNVTVVGNTVNGGSGSVSNVTSNGSGSQAIWLWGNGTPVPTFTITGNMLLGGTGTIVTNNTASAYAIRAVNIGYSASTVFTGNTVDGGVISSGGQCPQAVDIFGGASAPGSVVVSGNRIHAGHCTAFAPNLNNLTHALGLRLSGPFSSLLVENNMIDGGQVDVHRNGEAIDLVAVNGGVIRHNTLVAGGSNGFAFGIWLQGATTTVATTLENNIFAAVGPNAIAINSDNAGVCMPDAGTAGVRSFQNNLLFGAFSALLRMNCSGTPVVTTLDGLDATFAAGGATVGGNVTIASSCTASDGGTQAGCIPMTCAADGGSCLDTVFAGWDDATSGYANLFSDAGFEGGCPAAAPPVFGGVGDGWALATGAATPPCSVVHSSLNDVAPDGGDAGVTVDLYGNCRGPTPSMGAAEYPPGAPCF